MRLQQLACVMDGLPEIMDLAIDLQEHLIEMPSPLGRLAELLRPSLPISPDRRPAETVWAFMRDNRRSNRVVTSFEDILDPCCEARAKLADQPWRTMTVGLRD